MAGNNQNNQRLQLSQTQVDRVIDNESKRVELQAAALRVQEKKADANKAIALESIKAQVEDNKHRRHAKIRADLNHKWFLVGFTLLLLIFCSICLFTGNKDIIMDLIKVLCGFALGFGIGRSNKPKPRVDSGVEYEPTQ